MTIKRQYAKAFILTAGLFLAAAFALPAGAQQAGDTAADLRGSDVGGAAGNRDNTRVQGLVFDSSGKILNGVQIWVMNDGAPADRMRAKTRKTGSYLIRNISRLYTRDDIHGISLRLLFEQDGYKSVQTVAAVPRNGLQRVYPILYRNDEEPATEGICTMLTGTVSDARGKPIKSADIKVTGVSGEDLGVDATFEKGSFEALLWNVPQQIKLSISSSSGSTEQVVNLQAPTRTDVFVPQIIDLVLAK